jgi:hypothetical protein
VSAQARYPEDDQHKRATNLVAATTVRVGDLKSGWGSAFFIADRHALTAAHNLTERRNKNSGKINAESLRQQSRFELTEGRFLALLVSLEKDGWMDEYPSRWLLQCVTGSSCGASEPRDGLRPD